MKFILLFLLDCFQLRHHKIVTRYEHIYLFVPHSHAFCILSMLLEFCSFESSWIAFFIWNFMWEIFFFELTDEEEPLRNLIELDVCFISGRFDSFSLLDFICGMGLFNTIQLFTMLPFHGYFDITFLGHTLLWSEWSLKIVFWTFFLLSLPEFISSFEICFMFFHP